MKKIIAFCVILLLAVSVYFQREISALFIQQNKQDIVAVVNGENILYEEIEALYDIRHAHKSFSPPSVEQLQNEYAELLYSRIEQLLVSQELKKHGLEISQEQVKAFEAMIQQGYDEAELTKNGEFKAIVEESGINYEFWKKQLKYRLEMEELQNELAKKIIISSDEILQYVEKNKNFLNNAEKVNFLVFKSKEEKILEDIRKLEDIKDYEVNSQVVQVERGRFERNKTPKIYSEPLSDLKEKEFSKIQKAEGFFFIVYMDRIEEKKDADAVIVYADAEKKLLDIKLPIAYQEWLASTLEESQIEVNKEFLPKNLPQEEPIQEVQTTAPQDLQETNETTIQEDAPTETKTK